MEKRYVSIPYPYMNGVLNLYKIYACSINQPFTFFVGEGVRAYSGTYILRNSLDVSFLMVCTFHLEKKEIRSWRLFPMIWLHKNHMIHIETHAYKMKIADWDFL
jgi:hypothetical protein